MNKYLVEIVSLDDTSLILDAKIIECNDYVDACDEACSYCDEYAEKQDDYAVDYYVFAETDDIFEQELKLCEQVIIN